MNREIFANVEAFVFNRIRNFFSCLLILGAVRLRDRRSGTKTKKLQNSKFEFLRALKI